MAITGTNGRDDLYSGGNADYIDGGAGDDTLVGNGGDDTLEGGKGADSLEGGSGADTFVYSLGDGNDTITDYTEEDVIKFESGTPEFSVKGDNIIITVGKGSSQKGTITVLNAKKDGTVITYEDADGVMREWPVTVKFSNKNKTATLTEDYNKDAFNIVEYSNAHDKNYDNVTKIDASAVEQDIHVIGNGKPNTITGSANNDTIEGGKGNDKLYGGEGADVFVWNKGDGNDQILDYANEDKIEIVDDSVKNFAVSGDNVILKLTSGKNISVIGGVGKFISGTDANGSFVYPNVIDVTENGKKVTLLDGYVADTFNVNDYEDFGTVARTIDASAVDQDLSIVGNKNKNVIIGSDGDNTIDGGKGADSLVGGSGDNVLIGGKGNDTLTGGDGENTFVFNSNDGKDVITNYKSGDVIQVTSGVISGAISGKDYVLSFSGGGSVTLKDAKNKYIKVVDDKGAGWFPDNPTPQLVYSSGTVTIKKKYKDDTFDVNVFEDGFAGSVFDIDATAVTHEINIIGNKQKNSITGSDNNDTIEGGKGNDTLFGGEGADTFVWNKGDGNDKILDYTNEDKLVIADDTVTTISKSGENFIVKLASKAKITLVGGADKFVTYTDATGDHFYPEVINVTEDGEKVTLLKKYSADEFDVNAFEDIDETAVTIDASKVNHDLTIIGNKNNNVIVGTIGNNTIIGGKGNDTFTGGSGGDTFVWNKGDGRDVITDYKGDTIQVNDTYSTYYSGKNLFIKTSNGSIKVLNAKGKVVKGFDKDGNRVIFGDIPDKVLTYDKSTKTIHILKAYTDDSFDINDYESKYGDRVFGIDASEAKNALKLTGNKISNEITGSSQNDYIDGGKGNDSLWGGAGKDTLIGGNGDDTLTGGNGNDTFVYAEGGDGVVTITDYSLSLDKIMVLDGVASFRDVEGDDVIFDVGNNGGQIVVQGAASKSVQISDGSGRILAQRLK